MPVERCTKCGNYVDLDYNTNGEYIPDEKGNISHDSYHCENCVIELEEEEETKS